MNTEWIKTLAPLIGTALAGPFGGAAAGFLADKLGVKESTVEAVSEVLSTQKLTGDQLASIKAAEIEFQRFMETNKITLAQIEAADTKSARDMQIAVRSNMPAILTCIVTVGFFGILGFMILNPDIKQSEAMILLLGALNTSFGTAVGFWLGSSHGSQNKDALLAQAPAIK